MKIFKKIKGLVLKCDLFKTTQFLRYKGDAQYSTFTGGFCSIFIIILFAALFYNAVIATINKTKMMWAYNLIQTTNDQLQIVTSTKSQAKFMVAVGINNLDMNSGQRYFDLRLSQFISIGGVTTQKQIPLSPCSREVWEGANQEILQIYDRYNFSKFLCPPQNITFDIKGSKVAYDYRYVKAYAVKCNDSLSSRPCANTTTLTNFLQNNQNFHLNFYFINGLLNPTSQQDITYYLQDRNYVPFNLVYGGSREIMISRYNITTDQSISPFEDNRQSKGGLATLPGIYLAASVFQGEYAGVYLKRSYITFDIDRNYTKMDSTMSYIGGLFGFFVIAFIFMQIYTQYSFQIEIGDKLYYYDQKTPFNANKFHFISFVLYGIYNLCNFFGCSLNIELMKKFDECRNQIQKQFDMAFLMKRIIFFQRGLRILFEDHQFKGLHMHDKMTLKEAQELRSYYRLRDKLKDKLHENQQNQSHFDRDSQEENSRSHELNLTENIIGKVVEQTLTPNFQNVQDQKFKNFPYSRKVHPSHFNKLSKDNTQQNNSQAIIHQNTVQMKRIESNIHKGIFQSNKVALSSKIKILRKESQKGNSLSKKIFQGLDSTLLKNILLRIEQKVENQQNQISILENENDFEIRISKRREINDLKQNEQHKSQNILNIDQQKSDDQVSKIQIHTQHQQLQIPRSDTLENQRQSSKSQKNKITQNLKDEDTFQYAI